MGEVMRTFAANGMPYDDEDVMALLLRWVGGNASAAQFLYGLICQERLADDIADGDSENPGDDVRKLIARFFTSIPRNEFYVANADVLLPQVLTNLITWEVSDELKMSPRERDVEYSFYNRVPFLHLVTTVAVLTVGYERARIVAKEAYELIYGQLTERLETYKDEAREGVL